MRIRIQLAFAWDAAPAAGRFEFSNAHCAGGGLLTGHGTYDPATLSFQLTSAGEPCRFNFGIDADPFSDQAPPGIRIHDIPNPVSLPLRELLGREDGTLCWKDRGLIVCARVAAWTVPTAPARSVAGSDRGSAGSVPLFPEFTQEQRRQFGPVRCAPDLETVRRIYTTPFLYDNVEVGDFYEIDPTKGLELKADTGFISIREERPVVAVTVVGSGCGTRGYNICEWWNADENIDSLQDQLVKRQRIDGLNGIHPMILLQILMGTFPGLNFADVLPDPDVIPDPVTCLKKLSRGFYEELFLGFYENTAHFQLGPPWPRRITIRGGCKSSECPGVPCFDEYPAHYAFRLISVEVLKHAAAATD